MPMTLVEELALEQPKLRAGVIQTMVEAVNVLDRLPLESTGALQQPVVYLSGVPTVSLRFVNEAVTDQKATWAQLVESLSVIDTDVDIDPVLLAVKNQVQDVGAAQTEAIVASLAARVNDLIVNGNPVSNAREPTGLNYRLGVDPRFNGQTVNATGSATRAEFKVGSATDANILTVLSKIDELFYLLDNKASALLCNRQFLLAMWANLRQIKMFDTTRDNFDREVVMYRKVPILDVGFDPAGVIDGTPAAANADGNQIISNDNDDPTGNGANAYVNSTTLYACRFGPDHMLGLQLEPLRVKPIGETDTSPHYVRTNIRWVLHPSALFQKRSAARLVGLRVSDSAAL